DGRMAGEVAEGLDRLDLLRRGAVSAGLVVNEGGAQRAQEQGRRANRLPGSTVSLGAREKFVGDRNKCAARDGQRRRLGLEGIDERLRQAVESAEIISKRRHPAVKSALCIRQRQSFVTQ